MLNRILNLSIYSQTLIPVSSTLSLVDVEEPENHAVVDIVTENELKMEHMLVENLKTQAMEKTPKPDCESVEVK